VTLIAILSTALPPERSLAARRRRRWIRTRRARGVARGLLQLTLELLNASLQLLDAQVHTQQHLDDDLPASVIDRLRLTTLHALVFDATGLCPTDPLNAYQNPAFCGLLGA
jgi:hypothetical protein